MDPSELKAGRKYRVTFLGPQGIRRHLEGTFLEKNKIGTYIFDARPEGGNFYLQRQDFVDAVEVKR